MAREVLDVQALSRPAPVSGRPARAAVRRRRLDAAAADGRPRRRRPRRRSTDDVRAKMKLLGALPEPKVKPTAYDAALQTDAAPFDSVPGVGFDTDPAAAAIVPPAGPHHRQPGRCSSSIRRRTTPSGDQPRVEAGRDRAGERRRVGRADSVHAARPVAGRAGRARAVAGAAGRAHRRRRPADARPAAAHRPLSAVERQHGRRLDALGARAVRLRVRRAAPRRLQVAARAEDRRR